ncbi:phage major capsid protein [Microbacterium sp. ZW T5_45]|uniref:phage major capsid protein n=1 Tax=Microbacterium sp. ZW T5_45 TaxID=3378080 RepID=UPI0038546399
MSITTNTDDVSGLLPDDYGSLIVQPVTEASIAFQVADVIPTSLHRYVIPLVTEDATASWTAEGQEIAESDPTFDKLVVELAKLAGLTETTTEMLEDSDPEAGDVIGASIARDIAKKVDQAFFGNLAAPAPKGLGSITADVNTVTVTGGILTNLDPFANALSLSEQNGGSIQSFIANPSDALLISTLKKQADSIEPVLNMNVSRPGAQSVFGVPLLRSPAVPVGTIWGVDPTYAKVILRKDVDIDTSEHAAFTRDAVLIRAVMRLGFGFPHPKALSRILITA